MNTFMSGFADELVKLGEPLPGQGPGKLTLGQIAKGKTPRRYVSGGKIVQPTVNEVMGMMPGELSKKMRARVPAPGPRPTPMPRRETRASATPRQVPRLTR